LKKQAKRVGWEKREEKKRKRGEQTFSDDCPTNRDIIESRISICVFVCFFYVRSPFFPSNDSFCLLPRFDLHFPIFYLTRRRESMTLDRSRVEFLVGLPVTTRGFGGIYKQECTLVSRCCIETRYSEKYKRTIDRSNKYESPWDNPCYC